MPRDTPTPAPDPSPQAQPDTGLPTLHQQGGVATITLQRPAHHNRLHVEDLLALQSQFAAAQASTEARVLVLTGTGKSFCSGFHLGSLGASVQAAAAGPRLFEETVDALEALALPTVCVLNGGVYGGAIDLALACDFRLGVSGLQARMPAARLGLHYYPSGLRRYVTRLGLQNAKRLFLLAETLGAAELLAMGFLDRLVSAEDLAAEAQAMVEALAAGAPLAVRGMKASLNEIARAEYHLASLRERETTCAQSADLREGQAALAEKRAPQFNGR